METPQNLFRGFGKLLNRVKNFDSIMHLQVRKQRGVRFSMNPRLKSAQIDRHAVGNLMGECLPKAFTRAQSFFPCHDSIPSRESYHREPIPEIKKTMMVMHFSA
jgi:hypothetical protein